VKNEPKKREKMTQKIKKTTRFEVFLQGTRRRKANSQFSGNCMRSSKIRWAKLAHTRKKKKEKKKEKTFNFIRPPP